MTRSIFDPTGGETERSGSTFTPQRADNTSHMPPAVTDGEVSEQEAAEAQADVPEGQSINPTGPASGAPEAGDEYDH